MKKFIVFAVALSLALAMAAMVPAHALSERIAYLMEKKIIEGDEKGNLMLEEEITRAALAKIVVYAIGQQDKAANLKNAPSIFKDMKAGGWANGYANVAATEGIVNGYPNGNFGPNDPVTYEQAIKMLTIAALGKDLTAAEKEGKPWATPYIQKASEMGLLKHLNVTTYDKVAPREQIFDILYEVMRSKENQKTAAYRGFVSEVLANGKAKVVIMRGEQAEPYKAEDIVELGFAGDVKAEDYLGRVIDFRVGDDKLVRDITVAGEYEVLVGGFTIGTDGLLYMDGNKRGYVIDEAEKTIAKDRLVNIVHNDENYSLKTYRNEIKDKVDYAFVTVHNSKVMFIRSFSFKDIAPVTRNEKGAIYVIRDSSPRAEARQNVQKALEVTKNGLVVMDPARISVDDVLHIYKDGFAIVSHQTLTDVRFKVEQKDKKADIVIGSTAYQLPAEENFRAVLNADFKVYATIDPAGNLATLKAMEGKKSVVLLDLFGRVQLVRGDLGEVEELGVVDAVAGEQIRYRENANKLVDVKDNYGLEIREGKNVLRMTDLRKGDVVYTFWSDGNMRRIARIRTLAEVEKNLQTVDKKDGRFAIDLSPSRGRYALVSIGGQVYELTADTRVALLENGTYTFTTIENVAKTADAKNELKAFVLSAKDFQAADTGSKIPGSDRSDLASLIVFSNYKEALNVQKDVIVRLVYGFNPKLDKTFTVETAQGDRVEYAIASNAQLEEFKPGAVVKLSLDEKGNVLKGETLITDELRQYQVLSYLEKDGVTSLKIRRVDTNEEFVKYLARDVVIFGDLKEGSVIRMHVVRDDITALEVVK